MTHRIIHDLVRKQSTVYDTAQLTEICPNLTQCLRFGNHFHRPTPHVFFFHWIHGLPRWRNCLHTSLMHCCTSRLVQLLAPNLNRRSLRPFERYASRCLMPLRGARRPWPPRLTVCCPLDSDREKSVGWHGNHLNLAAPTARGVVHVSGSDGLPGGKQKSRGTNQPNISEHDIYWYDMWVSLSSYISTDFVSFGVSMLHHAAHNIYTETQTRDSWLRLRLVRSRWMCLASKHILSVYAASWIITCLWNATCLTTDQTA